LTEPILFEEYLDFTSGYQDPPFIIPKCSQTPTCSSSQARPSASSGNPANSVHAPDAYGSSSQSINWDFALFSTTDAECFVPEPSSSLRLSSSAALTGSLTSSPNLLNYPSWNTFSLPSGHDQYLGNDSQLLSGGPIPFPTSRDALNAMAITTGTENLHNGHFSTPMVKGTASALSFLIHSLILYRSLNVRFVHRSALPRLVFSGTVCINQSDKLKGQSPCSSSFQNRKAQSQHNGRAPLSSKARRPDEHSGV
jgi:hypothetical protein